MNSRAEKCDKECLGSDGRERGMKEGMDGVNVGAKKKVKGTPGLDSTLGETGPGDEEEVQRMAFEISERRRCHNVDFRGGTSCC